MPENRYTRLEQMEWWDGCAVSSARALVLGGGALGNEVIKNLLLLGWGRILVVDYDHIEISNLSRSILFREDDLNQAKATTLAKNARLVNPDCRIMGINGDLQIAVSVGIVKRMDVVFGCVDNVQARLAQSKLAGLSDRILIDGGLAPWEGTVSVYRASEGACYACGLTRRDLNELNLRRSCPAYAARAHAAAGVPTTPTVSSIVGALMVQEALKWIHGHKNPPDFSVSSQMRIDAAYNRFWKYDLPRNPECVIHPVPVEPVEDHDLQISDSWDRIIQLWRKRFSTEDVSIQLPVPILEYWECRNCGIKKEINEVRLLGNVLNCEECGARAIPSFRNQIVGVESWLNKSPAEMAFPPWTWLTVCSSSGKEVVFELVGSGEHELREFIEGD